MSSIVRRVVTGRPTSALLRQDPFKVGNLFRSEILVTTGNDWRRFYTRRTPFVPPTVSELPVPTGCWEKNFKKQNERYNRHLGGGIAFFLFTIFVVSQVATFNFSPPPLATGDDNDLCPPPQKKCK